VECPKPKPAEEPLALEQGDKNSEMVLTHQAFFWLVILYAASQFGILLRIW
jgi:hypothetical protein